MNTSSLLRQFAAVDSAAVSDALDRLGLPSGIGGIRPICGAAAIVGFAVTVGLEPHDGRPAGAHIATTAIESANSENVIVVDNQGRTDVSCWGGILSLGAAQRGVLGVVADGVCRDVAEARDLGFPVFSRGAVPATARGRLQQRSTGEAVSIGGLKVRPGDVVLADETGIVVVPRDRAEEIVGIATAIVTRERAIADEVRGGSPLSEAMHDARLSGEENPPPMNTTTPAWPVVSTATISDALDSLGLPGSLNGIGPLRAGLRIVGPAFTVRYEPIDGDGGTVGDFLDDVPAGAVVLIDNAGRTDCTVWGGIMSRIARSRGIAGTVINGVCRDVATAYETGYPIWSAGQFMRTGKDRVRVAEVQGALTIDGVEIHPGDIVVADDDGAVVIPAGRGDEVVGIAERIDAVEEAIVDAVRAGATLAGARASLGYHSLQTRKESA